MRASFYIDGFNLYYRAVRGTPYKWLDLGKLCQRLAPGDQFHRIRYFTALVDERDDAQRPLRQQIYLRALDTIPNLTVHLGKFRTRTRARPLAVPIEGLPRVVDVTETEEKGTDVNIATFLLLDGFAGDYEKAVLVSNDADLASPVNIVRTVLNLQVIVVNPNIDPKQPVPRDLSRAASSVRQLKEVTLRDSLFPPTLTDAHGTITKPASW